MGGNTRDGSTPFSRIETPGKSGVSSFRRSSATPRAGLWWPIRRNCAPSRPTQGFRTCGSSPHRWSGDHLTLVAIEAGDAQANLFRRAREISVPGHHDNFVIPQFERRRQVDRVVAAQPQVFGVLAGTNRKFVIDAYGGQIPIQRLKVCERPAVLIRSKPIPSTSSRQGRPPLRIGKDARCRRIGTPPELGRHLRPVLDDHELDQRRGVEVEDQARCSETRSETEPTPFTRAERGRRFPRGIRTRPRRARASSGRSPSPLRRATGRPRRVTTISPPPSTCSRYSLSRSCNSRTPTSLSRRCSVICLS